MPRLIREYSGRYRQSLLACLVLLCSFSVHAATYYIDSQNGDDSLAGTAPEVGSGNGPWKTLNKLTLVTLAPGDNIMLSCGKLWRETLKINQSGTAGNPITVSGYGDNCSTSPPRISGFNTIPAAAWQRHSANIWKVQFPINVNTRLPAPTHYLFWSKASTTNATVVKSADCSPYPAEQCYGMVANAGGQVRSPVFPLKKGDTYTLEFSIRVPKGFTVNTSVVSSNGTFGNLGFLAKTVNAMPNWQTVRQTFVASESEPAAVIALNLPAGSGYRIRDAFIKFEASGEPIEDINQVYQDDQTLLEAHHPNIGHDAARPKSFYFKTLASTNKALIKTDIDFTLPADISHAQLVGLPIRVRGNNFRIDSRTIASSVPGTITLSSDMPATVPEGYGFYLLGALWMLDAKAEWFFDKTTQILYARTTDDASPADRMSYGTNMLGIDVKGTSDLSRREHITFDGLMVDHLTTGIEIANTRGIKLLNMVFTNLAGRAITGGRGDDMTLDNSIVTRTGNEAIFLQGSINSVITNNDFDQIGVQVDENDTITSLPVNTAGAISAGTNSTIQNNRLSNFNYVGLDVKSNDQVINNAVWNGCLVLNDCGGIYTQGTGTTIQGNLVSHLVGNTDGGIPVDAGHHTVGIYLDNAANGITVSGNAVNDVEFGIQVHVSFNHTIANNSVFGASGCQFFLQEDSGATSPPGSDNSIRNVTATGNNFFPASATGQVCLTSSITTSISDVRDFFANLDLNNYSTYFSPIVASEGVTGTSVNHTFAQWQTTQNSNLSMREPAGQVKAPQGNFAFGTISTQLVTNSKFETGTTSGWKRFASGGSGNPVLDMVAVCDHPDPGTNCASVTAAATSVGNLSSPSFAVTKDLMYLLSFDAKISVPQTLEILVRQGSGSFSALMTPIRPSLTTDWKRYSLVFKATGTADGAGGSPLARVDFLGLASTQVLTITNLEVAPFSTATPVPQDARFVANFGRVTKVFDCPSAESIICTNYQRFPDNTSVIFPFNLNPLEFRVFYTQNLGLSDSDQDGIPDSQDICPSTPANQGINMLGCRIGE